ncbi:MAG: carboxylesterase/lipase family protein [Rhodobiaceae bacterium]|nr:carboxylesterase/lipase family protein [Hyphomonas sp.]MCB9971219.1 carboxylesterase/lipase family protein [Hyphomonas sp.]MCC0050288.1 carboxylesterase/lipase family protein [Rhodobiaceae bacterium]
MLTLLRRQLSRLVAVALCALVAPFLPALAQTGAAAPIVQVSNGALQGTMDHDVLVFRGIPYAVPPVGANRWRPPAAAADWSGVRDASAFGDACIQPPGMSAENGGDPGPLSEDCLYLNVWTPTISPGRPLPVVVWIHGGAYVFGGGSVEGYSGVPYARDGVVFVTLNYRLGALGFFAHPALNGEPGTVANFGLMDQIAALHWVQKNIAAFGGDPGNVTIMGQSAGARSVVALYTSPLANGLFQKGVAMSAYVLPEAGREKAESVAANIATAVGLDGADATADELRSVPGMAFAKIDAPDTSLGPVPIVGDLVLPKSAAEVFADGREAKLPLIVGSTSDDASVIAAFGLSPEAIIEKLGALKLGLAVLYPDMSKEERARQVLRDVIFTMNPKWTGNLHAKRAHTWRYYFDYVAEADREALPHGAPHGYEVAFFLDTLPFADGIRDRYTQNDLAMADALSGYLVEFARTGAPPADWQAHSKSRDRILRISNETLETEKHFMTHRMRTFIGATKLIRAVL